jgi:hypothetical protein
MKFPTREHFRTNRPLDPHPRRTFALVAVLFCSIVAVVVWTTPSHRRVSAASCAPEPERAELGPCGVAVERGHAPAEDDSGIVDLRARLATR